MLARVHENMAYTATWRCHRHAMLREYCTKFVLHIEVVFQHEHLLSGQENKTTGTLYKRERTVAAADAHVHLKLVFHVVFYKLGRPSHCLLVPRQDCQREQGRTKATTKLHVVLKRLSIITNATGRSSKEIGSHHGVVVFCCPPVSKSSFNNRLEK